MIVIYTKWDLQGTGSDTIIKNAMQPITNYWITPIRYNNKYDNVGFRTIMVHEELSERQAFLIGLRLGRHLASQIETLR